MFVDASKPLRKISAKAKPILFSLILSMSLTGCALIGTDDPQPARLQFVSLSFTDEELECMDAPTGQLPRTATNEDVAERFRKNDEAGEDCRQKLGTVRTKVRTADDIIDQINAQNEENP